MSSAAANVDPNWPHIVIVGAGFGGLAVAQQLANAPVRVTVVDRNNYHLFVPLLYQVATAALSPADVAEPIRHVLGRYPNIRVVLGEVVQVDTDRHEVALATGETLTYDRLVVATGSTSSYFGHDEWRSVAPSCKSIEEARVIRSRVLGAFEEAERDGVADREALMTFVIVGGGPTGVELAGSVAELARHALTSDFRRIRPETARIILVEGGKRILAAFPDELADYAERALSRLGVQVMTDCPVEAITAEGLTAGGQFIPARTVLWGAGVAPTGAAKLLGIAPGPGGRVAVGSDLKVVGIDDVYSLGDVAACPDEQGKPLPGLAQVAQQQGQYLGKALRAGLTKEQSARPFRFHNRGNAAIIGRHAAIFDFGRFRMKGYLAWMLWAIVHVVLLVSFAQRIRVSLQWLWRYLTYRRGARIITTPLARPPG
ncbi:NAD(P)/FAD-dependent oxidoreductase [Sphingomonas sanguinis]|uniref:NAD(P)/FAD-dependent oxidoreductase n=1 Tax=Sphingomonas sp. LC-1 TaxID=3110957 RepID=UPI0021BB29D5|nr:NAD(P)/FAD-dependent oxidoreductase [Sphingomonas sp. LC-1]MCT8000394.1 NAD(P)/FAD-dependent oxidoreductase [Sphingomonas sp. LC-1]